MANLIYIVFVKDVIVNVLFKHKLYYVKYIFKKSAMHSMATYAT